MQQLLMAFKKIPQEKKRQMRVPLRFTYKEAEAVRKSAQLRMLTVSDFIRRAALGRKAELRCGSHIILELRSISEAIRRLYHEFVRQGMVPPEDVLLAARQEVIHAIQRTSD